LIEQMLKQFEGLGPKLVRLLIKALLQPARLANQMRQTAQALFVVAVDVIAITHQPTDEIFGEDLQQRLADLLWSEYRLAVDQVGAAQ
jgi:hypothetical protein